jgi:sensor histidine kinase regulating citrate/malate metabolism
VLIGLYERWKKWESIEVKFHIKQYFVLYGGIISAVILVGCAQELSAPENLSIKEKNGFGFAIVIICILFMFLWLWNSIIAYHQEQYRHQIERLNEHLEMQENQIKTVIQSDEKLRAYRHDMKAHLLALQALCEEEETQNDRFKRYVDEIIQTSEIFHKISFTGNTAIDAVLSRLNETAIASDIQISYECTLMEKLPITLFELCTILFNLIQNAIEACEKNQEGKEISVTMYPFGDRLYIVVKNSVENDVQIEQERLITSKTDKKNHGIGSRNVRLVTQKYNGALNYFCENGWFSAEILI